MKRNLILTMLLCLLVLFTISCSGTTSIDPTINLPIGKIQAINIIPGIVWVDKNETYRFTARGIFPGGAIGDVTFLATWFSDDPTVGRVIGPGLVKGGLPGLAHITCTYEGVGSSTVTVAVPGVPLVGGIVPVSIDVSPPSLAIPIEQAGMLSYVPTPATAEEMALVQDPKPAFLFVLGDAADMSPEGYWADSTLRLTSGAGAGLEFEVLNNYTSPMDTNLSDPLHPLGPDWIPDGVQVFEISSDVFPYDWGVAAGDTYMVSKRWLRFVATATYSDNSKANVTASSRWHMSDPTLGFITNTGYLNSTAEKPANLIVYCEFSGLISNYVPISVR